MIKSALALTLLAPISALAAATCSANAEAKALALVLQLLGKPATSFCSSYIHKPTSTIVLTSTSTVTSTFHTTYVAATETDATTQYELFKRANPTPAGILAVLAGQAAASITAACSCITIPLTITVTTTTVPSTLVTTTSVPSTTTTYNVVETPAVGSCPYLYAMGNPHNEGGRNYDLACAQCIGDNRATGTYVANSSPATFQGCLDDCNKQGSCNAVQYFPNDGPYCAMFGQDNAGDWTYTPEGDCNAAQVKP